MIVFVNMLILTIMLAICTDAFELAFNNWVRPVEFLKLIGISLAGLLVLRIAVSIFRKSNINSFQKRKKISILLIVLMSSYFYVDYGIKIYSHRFANAELRDRVIEKRTSYVHPPYGSEAKNLTGNEYVEITKTKWFPKLPENAKNISYSYSYDGFLPDYSLSIVYDVPKETKVDTLNYKDNTFSKTRTFELKEDHIRVTYTEYLW